MDKYIVFDLEWNQSPRGKEESVSDLPFEIIEIGAVKLDRQFHITEEFHRLIRPQVYRQMHYMITEVTHMDMGELRREGESFEAAVREFLDWCGEDAVYCTWGSMDLTELQRNLAYYGMENPFPKPLFYYDVQKLYGLFYRDGEKVSLDAAVEDLAIPAERPFHRAADDAYYTAKVLEYLDPELFGEYRSIDYYRLPESREEEIRILFPGYFKYVSRAFPSKEDAMEDRGVTEIRCYACGRALRKKVRWFTPNQRIYYGLAICPEHGYLKGKIRMKKADGENVFAVKTLKFTDEDGAAKIIARKDDVRRKRSERSRAKRKRQRVERSRKAKSSE